MKSNRQDHPTATRHFRLAAPLTLMAIVACLGGCPASDDEMAADGGGVAVDMGPLPSDESEACNLEPTGFPGDDLCLLPPKKGTGMQLHAGPKDYNDPKEVEPFLLAPGKEVTECYYLNAPNTEHAYYFPRKARMRPGSHHLITYVYGGERKPEGWGPCSYADERRGSFGGAETTVVDYPTGNITAPENENLIKFVPANAQVKFEWHHINTTEKPILREAWLNVYWAKETKKSEYVQDMFMIGAGLNVPPHQKQIVHNECTIDGETRIIDIFGHFHAHTTRFSAWRTRGDKSELFYEVFDWHDPGTMAYDSLTDNGVADRDTLTRGGMSGVLDIKPGDVIEWECEIDNTTDLPLREGNYVETAEMCNLFGTYQGNSAALLMCRGKPTVTTITAD